MESMHQTAEQTPTFWRRTMLERLRNRATGRAYRMARTMGRGRFVSAWLQSRFWLTGRTGSYRIY